MVPGKNVVLFFGEITLEILHFRSAPKPGDKNREGKNR
jgi:hypothetical protein